jgi:hypothetical protein
MTINIMMMMFERMRHVRSRSPWSTHDDDDDDDDDDRMRNVRACKVLGQRADQEPPIDEEEHRGQDRSRGDGESATYQPENERRK